MYDLYIYRDLFRAMAPHFVHHFHFDYEIFPNLDALTHCVKSVQIILTPTGSDQTLVSTI